MSFYNSMNEQIFAGLLEAVEEHRVILLKKVQVACEFPADQVQVK